MQYALKYMYGHEKNTLEYQKGLKDLKTILDTDPNADRRQWRTKKGAVKCELNLK